eukprot:TRINITY_DN28106_c0_g1_i1.p1 TRINITY_DN28106_c0_g1~~TRINITY_DN28106_c0_g1_i1.p1  ORF type:complete len:350 (-),score=69.94 TRINITY_DN28106_c0_g1_i1:523-1542(-)
MSPAVLFVLCQYLAGAAEVCQATDVGCGERKNLCIGRKLSPELLVLGAEKAGSTSLCEMLSESPGIVFSAEPVHPSRVRQDGKLRVKKEASVFSNPSKFQKLGLRFFPDCSTSMRRVAVDCSPQYLYTPGTVGRIIDWYKESKAQLTFMIQLREPAKRFQSSFEFWRNFNKQTSILFADCAKRALEDSSKRKPPLQSWMENCDMNLNRTMYAEQISPYFKAFQPRQFIIVPMSYTVAPKQGDYPAVPEFVWRHLGVELPAKAQNVLHETKNKHGRIEDDLEPLLLSNLRDMFDRLTGAKILASIFSASPGSPGGSPILYGFQGSSDDKDAIARWLSSGW